MGKVVCVERLNELLGVMEIASERGCLMMAKWIIVSTILHPIVSLLIATFWQDH